jgi:hypothetical protein
MEDDHVRSHRANQNSYQETDDVRKPLSHVLTLFSRKSAARIIVSNSHRVNLQDLDKVTQQLDFQTAPLPIGSWGIG